MLSVKKKMYVYVYINKHMYMWVCTCTGLLYVLLSYIILILYLFDSFKLLGKLRTYFSYLNVAIRVSMYIYMHVDVRMSMFTTSY